MEVPQAVSLLTNTLEADHVVRKGAESALKQLETVPGHVVVLFRLSSDPSLQLSSGPSHVSDDALRQCAAIRMKNIVGQGWVAREGSSQQPLSDPDKAALRDNLLEAMIIAPPLVRSQLSLCLNAIARHDYPERWPALLPAICAELTHGQSAPRVFGALSALRVLAKVYEYKRDEARKPLHQLTQASFPLVHRVLAHLLTAAPSIETSELLLLGLKILYSCMLTMLPPFLLEAEAHWKVRDA